MTQSLCSAINPLESLPPQNKTLEQETSQLEKDKKLLEKENKRLRQQAEIRDSKLDDNNQRISALEKENRTMGKEMIFFRDSCTRVKDLERETKELVKQGSIDKKTLMALREVRMSIISVGCLNISKKKRHQVLKSVKTHSLENMLSAT